jgi:hypothetical protein
LFRIASAILQRLMQGCTTPMRCGKRASTFAAGTGVRRFQPSFQGWATDSEEKSISDLIQNGEPTILQIAQSGPNWLGIAEALDSMVPGLEM